MAIEMEFIEEDKEIVVEESTTKEIIKAENVAGNMISGRMISDVAEKMNAFDQLSEEVTEAMKTIDSKDDVSLQQEMAIGAVSDMQLMKDLAAIPKKMAFKIGDVAQIVGVKPYVLRYWESEFEILKPRKSGNNQRMYTRRDVETVTLIKKLLYRDRFSITGARSAIKKLRADVKENTQWMESLEVHSKTISNAKSLLEDIRSLRSVIKN